MTYASYIYTYDTHIYICDTYIYDTCIFDYIWILTLNFK